MSENKNRGYMEALLAAYNEEAGLNVALTPDRVRVLRQLDIRKLTPADVRAVMQELRRLTVTDSKRYPEACLLFANAIAHVDRFEERAHMLRKRVQDKKKSASPKPVKTEAKPQVSPEEQKRRAEEFKRQNAALFGGKS
jgi:hypothetical protein